MPDDFTSSTATTGSLFESIARSVHGNIETSGDHDWFRLNLEAGTRYAFNLQAADTGDGTLSDPFLNLYNSSGSSIASNDDSGEGRNSQIIFTPISNGIYYLGAQAFSAGTGTYVLFAGLAVDMGTVRVGVPNGGTIETPGDEDWWTITLAAGTRYQFDLEGVDTGEGTLSDPFLRLYNGSGSSLLASDDDGGTGRNSSFIYTPTTSGSYRISASGFGDNTGSFQLSVTATSVSTGSTYTLSPGPLTVREDVGTVTFTLSRSPGGGTETVYFYVSDGGDGHRAGDDGYYNPSSVTFFSGDTSKTFTFDIDDGVAEPDETFEILAYRTFQFDPYARPSTFVARTTLTVIDDDGGAAELRASDLVDAAFLSRAAYSGGITRNGNTFLLNLDGQTKWQYVNPTALYSSASVINGYFSQGVTQALLALDTNTHTLAIAFRGTAEGLDTLADVSDKVALYNLTANAFVDSVIANASSFGVTRVLITGHSLGGAMAEAAMADHSRDTQVVGVTFGSPGVRILFAPDGDLSQRLINVGHADPDSILDLQGDPVFNITPFDRALGFDLRVSRPDTPDYSLDQLVNQSRSGDLGEHAKTLYDDTANIIADVANRYDFDIRAFSYVIGNGWGAQLTGDSNANVIIGEQYRDTLRGNGGNDILVGGSGIDVAIYSGPRSGYSLSNGANGRTILDRTAGRDGSDTLGSIERLQFSDSVLAFDNSRTDSAGRGYLLYRAAFDRAPDASGLGYWTRALDAGMDFAGVMAASFIASPEFIRLYGNNTSNAAFLNLVYQNVLDRAPDQGGSDYWLGSLNNGYSRANMLASFAISDENYNSVSPLISDGIWFT